MKKMSKVVVTFIALVALGMVTSCGSLDSSGGGSGAQNAPSEAGPRNNDSAAAPSGGGSSAQNSPSSEAGPRNNDSAAAPSGGGSVAQNDSRVKTARPAAERNAPVKTDAELVAEAIAYGDCAFLYEYVARGKENTEPKLVTNANNAIKRYTSLDTGTSKYRNNKMEARIRRVPKELMEQIFIEPETAIPGVVSSLTNGISDQFLKMKTLHDWICDNIAYDAEMFFSGRITGQDYASVLKKKKGVCSGYTNLMNQMCELAGIESIGINGYSKGFGYTGKIGRDTDHAWNAVHIGNKWYLVDVTWDAGHLDRRTYIKSYSTEWLFLDPRPFLYSHLPEEDAYQYYAPVLTADDFMREAYIAGKFFQYGLSLKTEDPEYNNIIDGGFTFDITMRNNNVSTSSQLRTSNQQNVNAASWSDRKGTTVTFDFDVPDTNQYEGNIFARYTNGEKPQDRIDIGTYEGDWLPRAEALFNVENPKDRKITEKELEYFKDAFYKVADNGYYYMLEDQFDTPRNNAVLKIQKLLDISVTMLESVLNFNIKAASGYQGFGTNTLKYPYTFSAYNNVSNTELLAPLKGALQSGASETFTVSSKDFSKIAIVIDGEFYQLVKNRSGNFELAYEIPAGINELTLYASRDGKQYTAIVRYDVRE